MKKQALAIAFALALAACGSESSSNAIESESAETPPAAETTTTTEAAPTTTEATTTTTEAEPELGTKENPYPLGQAHSRAPGFSGAGWSISIDEVFVDVTLDRWNNEPGRCIVLTGTATLESLEGDELTASSFSFPEIVVIADGRKAESTVHECVVGEVTTDTEWILDLELMPGATARWHREFMAPEGSKVDLVAVENTVYDFSETAGEQAFEMLYDAADIRTVAAEDNPKVRDLSTDDIELLVGVMCGLAAESDTQEQWATYLYAMQTGGMLDPHVQEAFTTIEEIVGFSTFALTNCREEADRLGIS